MKIVIAGAGDVGFHLAKLLSKESQDIVIIDRDEEILEYAQNHMDLMTISGDSTSIKTLLNAGVKDADLLVAATQSEQVNIITAVLGKKMGAKHTVARISKNEYLLPRVRKDFENVGVDSLVSPRQLASEEIFRLINETALTDMFEFEEGKLSLIGTTIHQNSQLLGQTVESSAHFNPDNQFKIIAIQRGHETIIPRGGTSFQYNDHAYFLATKKGIEQILEINGTKKFKIRNIMIIGGSSIGYMAAKMLEKNYNVKLIEKDKERCLKLAEHLSSTLIINSDGNNVEVLEEEGLNEMDALIALTGNSETNIISCLVAKNHNVPKTIALVENIDYIHLSQDIGVDTLINRKLIAANNVFRYIRKGRVRAITGIHGMNAEVIEYEVFKGAKITKSTINKSKFPKDALIGGVIRGEETILPLGDFIIKEGDKVIVFTTPEAITDVGSFFN